jgi:hypothetical protein
MHALAASIGSPNDVTLGPGGLLYIAASGEILRLNTRGTLTRTAGNQRYEGVFGVGSPAVSASMTVDCASVESGNRLRA